MSEIIIVSCQNRRRNCPCKSLFTARQHSLLCRALY